eukprot:5305071-Prymnesium_polylepis.1
MSYYNNLAAVKPPLEREPVLPQCDSRRGAVGRHGADATAVLRRRARAASRSARRRSRSAARRAPTTRWSPSRTRASATRRRRSAISTTPSARTRCAALPIAAAARVPPMCRQCAAVELPAVCARCRNSLLGAAAAQDSLMEDRTPDVEKKLKQMQAEKKKAETNAYVNPELAEAVSARAHTAACAPRVACRRTRVAGSGHSMRLTCAGVAAGARGGQRAVQGGQVPAGDREVRRRDEAQPEVALAVLQPRRVLPEAHG